ncbi:hypothetical protein M2349_001137 [Caldanaerobacter subterraneus subsp. tengcongensis MB4]|nr:hypothetical protein [Caldanaerobacter subterraneus]MCS3915996.1 hypothetical protein [Caldanaerobacter subterraneus subsp. tengcongensis MB4]
MINIYTVLKIALVGITMTFTMLIIFYLLIKSFGQTSKTNKQKND